MPYRSEFQDEVLLQRFDGGANSKDDAEEIDDNQSPNPRNVDFDAKTVRKAAGYTLFAGTESETVPGFFLYNHRILSSTELLLKTVNTRFKFYDSNAGTFHLATDATFTAGRRWWGASFNGYFYGGNGVENFVRWRASSFGTLASPVLAAAATIPLASGQGARFATSGNGIIEGDTFAWTGKSTDTLTGVTGLDSGHGTGAIAVEKLDSTTYSSQPKGSVGAFFNNRIFVRDDAAPNFVYFSKLADNTNPQDDLANFTIAGSGSGDAGFDILPAAMIAMKAFTNGDNSQSLVAFCADGVAYELIVTDNSSPASTVPTHPVYKRLGADVAAVNMVASTENSLLFVDSKGTLRDLGYSDISTIIRTNRLSDRIEPTVVEADFSNGYIEYFNRKAFFIGKQNDAGQNNFTVVKDTNPDAFTFYDHWQLNAIAEWENDLYGLSSMNGNVFKLFDGLSANGEAIDSSYPTHEINFGAPLNLKELRKLRVAGVITEGCNLYIDIYLDDEQTPSTFLINGSNSNVTTPLSPVAIGTVVFGRGVFGGSLPAGVTARNFIAELNLQTLKKFFVAQVVIRNSEKDVYFDLQKMRFFARKCSADLMPDARHLGQVTSA